MQTLWRGVIAAFVLLMGPPAFAQAAPEAMDLSAIARFDRAAHSQAVTPCDTLAGHPEDPDKVAPGVSQQAMDIPAAIAACQVAVRAEPGNPRLNYQLARAYGYAGRHAEGAPYRRQALMAGYPQSLFVVGFIMTTGWSGQPRDPCTGVALVRLSGVAGRKAGLIGYPHYVVNGALAGCGWRADKAELLTFLAQARPLATGYYEGLLLDNLEARVRALP